MLSVSYVLSWPRMPGVPRAIARTRATVLS